jgi:hypothetical protein
MAANKQPPAGKGDTGFSVEPGADAVFMTPGVPPRNTPSGALSPSERTLPVMAPPATKAMAAARTKNSATFSGPGLGSK